MKSVRCSGNMAKNETIIVISDDEDEVIVQPTNASLPGEGKLAKQNVQKTVIVIPDDDSNDSTSTDQVSSSTRDKLKPSPSKNSRLKFSEQNMKKLKASVKLMKLDVDSFRKVKAEKVNNGEVNDGGHLTLQVKVEKDDSVVNSHPPCIPGVGIFESLEKKLSPVKQVTMNMKNVPNITINKKNHCWGSTSSNKRLKSPPSSPSLRQSKLTEESFSPKKRCTINAFPRQEQPVAYSTPLHCSVPLRTSHHNEDCDPGLSKSFTETQMNSLQALKEENFQQTVLTTVSSFMNQSRKPPPALVFYLLNNILLSKQGSCSKQCYRLLKQIQVLHPVVARQMIFQKISWEFISMLVKLSKCTVSKFQSKDSSLAANASLALFFLVSVMEDEVKVKTFSHIRTSAHRLLNVFKWANHIQDVISWIEKSTLKHHSKQSNHSCALDMCPVYLLQRMLMLSLAASERPEDCASRIADEMILAYCQMPSLVHKNLFLQSVQSHVLRVKLIQVIINNCCPLDYLEQDDDAVPRSGLRRVIFVDFKRSPPGLNDGVSLSERVKNCEEFIMLQAYWLQSLVFCRKRSLQRNTSDSFQTLSMDDEDVLTEIDQNVVKLRARLETLCSPSKLSQRSYQLLDLISSLQSFAPKLL